MQSYLNNNQMQPDHVPHLMQQVHDKFVQFQGGSVTSHNSTPAETTPPQHAPPVKLEIGARVTPTIFVQFQRDGAPIGAGTPRRSTIGDGACGGTGSPTPALLTAEQAARVAGCSVNTITRSTHKELPRRGRGQRALFNHDDVVVFAAKERRRTPEPQPCQIDDLLARYRK